MLLFRATKEFSHNGAVTGISILTSHYVATASEDGSAKIWFGTYGLTVLRF